MGREAVGEVAVLVPVKSFAEAKVRLASALNRSDRAALARSMADRVVAAANPLPVAVVCEDDAVASWAKDRGAEVVWAPNRGLNGAVEDGVAWWAAQGASKVIVAHGDLPLATSLAWVARFEGVTLVPDRRDDGTNVACVPTGRGFTFSYGPASFARHRAETRRLQLPLHVVRQLSLAWDVDVPADLDYCDA